MLEFIRPGDELVVVKLDRLGRSTRDVLNLVHELEQKGAGLRVLEPEFCTSTDTGRILVTVLGLTVASRPAPMTMILNMNAVPACDLP